MEDVDDLGLTADIDNIEEDVEEEKEEQDMFPLKDATLSINKNGSTNIRKSSQGKQILHSYRQQHDDEDDGLDKIPNSLPINIPFNQSRKLTIADDDDQVSRLLFISCCKLHSFFHNQCFGIQPGESIADSIQKLARSVRNDEIMFDRPRRRLNTGDLIKSRPMFNWPNLVRCVSRH